MGLLSKWLRYIRTNEVAHHIAGDVLDVGCGQAEILGLFGDRLKDYVGIERESAQVKKLSKKYPKAEFFQRDLDVDDFGLKMKFDVILLVAVIEHVFNQKHLMQECLNYLKPDGKIIITTPTVFGNDVVHRLGAKIGLFSRAARDDHIMIYNKLRFEILANEFKLKMIEHKKFELGCNQLVVLKK